MRTCLLCRTKKEKSEFARIVRTPEGRVVYDPSGKMNGRGAYVCRNPECIRKMMKNGSLGRALRCPVPADTLARLLKEIEDDR